jgi:CMP-N-acetylneuraminic acid synthetase
MIDEYLYDFIEHEKVEYLAVVNPTSPFISSADLDRAWLQFINGAADTQLCCERIQTHCFLHGKAINFSTNGQHPRSQDIPPVLALNFAITIWNARKFADKYREKGHGVYTGQLGFFETEGVANIDIDYEDDFMFAEFVARFLSSREEIKAEYDPVIRGLIEKGIDTRN